SMIYKLIDARQFPPLVKAGSASLLAERKLVKWMEATDRGEVLHYEPEKGRSKNKKFIWGKEPPSYFDPPPTDEEIDRQIAEAKRRINEERTRGRDWLLF